jgi:hypothetical protein
MTKYLTGETRLLQLLLKDIFPLCDQSHSENDKDRIVNAAYTRLFEELIPGFRAGEVHFVLAEVLELDREESRPRILVYSNKDKDGVEGLLNEYFRVIESLRDDEWSISKADALYTGSRIWCAEMESAACRVPDDERSWVISVREKFPRGYEFGDEVDEEKEITEIHTAFEKYINALYTLHLKNYPFAYVMLIPIFLGSMYGKKKSRKKLGAIFLHFATTKRVENERALHRIYGRTLLFWHYYFTSEAIDKRQEMLEESIRTKESLELSVDLYKKIEPYIQDIRKGLKDLRAPLFKLEAEMNPVRGIIFSAEDLNEFFQVGPPIKLGEGLPEVNGKHDFEDDALYDKEKLEHFKSLAAGILLKAFHFEKDIRANGADFDFWHQVTSVICDKANQGNQPLFKELIQSVPQLCELAPTPEQVKAVFRILKRWFNDSYKYGRDAAGNPGPGLPVTMLEFALRVWGCKVNTTTGGAVNRFWVASVTPVQTLDALGILHEKHRFKEATLKVERAGRNGRGQPITSCNLKLGLQRSHEEVSDRESNLKRLRYSLVESMKGGGMPRGDTTRFLWTLAGGRELSLNRTVFKWSDENCEFSIDFNDADGHSKEISIGWKGDVVI